MGARGKLYMKTRIIIIALFITLANKSFSQTSEDDFYKMVVNVKTLTKLQNLKYEKYQVELDFQEQLNLGIKQTNWKLYRKKSELEPYFLTLSFGDRILYSEVYKSIITEDFTSLTTDLIISRTDSVLFEQINSKSNDKNIEIKFSHLGRQPIRSTFGYVCFAEASMPEEGLEMLKYVEYHNSEILIEWLQSINPIKQVYGYLGLKLLESKTEYAIPIDILAIMTDLKSSSIPIYSCSGCTIWEFIPINELLNDSLVNQFIIDNIDN